MNKEYNHVAAQVLLANKLKMEKMKTVQAAVSVNNAVFNSPLREVKGIGEKTIEKLLQAGIETTHQLICLSKDEIEEIVKNPISRKQVFDFLKVQDITNQSTDANSSWESAEENSEEEGSEG